MLAVTTAVESIIIFFRFIRSDTIPETGRQNNAVNDIKLAMVEASVNGAPRLKANFEISGVTIWEAVQVKTLIAKIMINGRVQRGSFAGVEEVLGVIIGCFPPV